MRILQIAPIERRLPVLRYGGIERVVQTLCEYLVARGHSVTLLAPAGSVSSASVQHLTDSALCEANPPVSDPKQREAYFIAALSNVLSAIVSESFDIIHNHLGWRFLPLYKISPAPFITTLQVPLDGKDKTAMWNECGTSPVVCVSESQRAARPNLNYIATVYNGIEVQRYPFSSKGSGYLLFLGRIAPEKGVVEAIHIAKRLGRVLIIAAAVHEWEKAYFQDEVVPRLDPTIRFVGEVNDVEKNVLLGGADALLNPIQWEEPFGIACIEAMACGTPVMTLRRGSMPELIDDGITGVVAPTTDEIISRFVEIATLDRRACRQRVVDLFSADKMVDRYEYLYHAQRRAKN
jgi:glycosyltransferase involved in cell wall biosynthesis